MKRFTIDFKDGEFTAETEDGKHCLSAKTFIGLQTMVVNRIGSGEVEMTYTLPAIEEAKKEKGRAIAEANKED